MTDRRSPTDRQHPFRDSSEDVAASHRIPETPQAKSPSYRLAFADPDFLMRDEMRPVRLQLEMAKAEIVLDELGIRSTVIFFGGARIPEPGKADAATAPGLAGLSRYYEEARKIAFAVTQRSLQAYGREWVICTGGGPGVMEAGNRGAAEAGGQSIGLNIVLPHEQRPNDYVTPELAFNFHYFGIRKMHFLMRAAAICVFPGGFGTMDETFEALTLIQTRRMKPVPVLMFGREYWERVVNWQALAEAGTISPEDLNLFSFVESAEEAEAILFAGEEGGVD